MYSYKAEQYNQKVSIKCFSLDCLSEILDNNRYLVFIDNALADTFQDFLATN